MRTWWPWLLALLAVGGASILLLDPDTDPFSLLRDESDVSTGEKSDGSVHRRPERVGVWGQGVSPPSGSESDAWTQEPLSFPEDGHFSGQRVVDVLAESMYVRFPTQALMDEFLAAQILPECPPSDEPHTKGELRAFLATAGYGLRQKGSIMMIVPQGQRPVPEAGD